MHLAQKGRQTVALVLGQVKKADAEVVRAAGKRAGPTDLALGLERRVLALETKREDDGCGRGYRALGVEGGALDGHVHRGCLKGCGGVLKGKRGLSGLGESAVAPEIF